MSSAKANGCAGEGRQRSGVGREISIHPSFGYFLWLWNAPRGGSKPRQGPWEEVPWLHHHLLVWRLSPLSLSGLCQLCCRDPIAQINFRQVLNLSKQVCLCLKRVANLDQSALQLAESRLRQAGEAGGTLGPDGGVSWAGVVKTPFPGVTVPLPCTDLLHLRWVSTNFGRFG